MATRNWQSSSRCFIIWWTGRTAWQTFTFASCLSLLGQETIVLFNSNLTIRCPFLNCVLHLSGHLPIFAAQRPQTVKSHFGQSIGSITKQQQIVHVNVSFISSISFASCCCTAFLPSYDFICRSISSETASDKIGQCTTLSTSKQSNPFMYSSHEGAYMALAFVFSLISINSNLKGMGY